MGVAGQSKPWSTELMALYQTHFTSLVRCGQQLLDSVELAEEAVQEAFVRFHDSGASPTPGKELAYLRASVRNNACSMMRRRQVSERQFPGIDEVVLDVDHAIVQRDEGAFVRTALAQLSTRQREVIELRYWHDMTEREMAIKLNMSTGSIKVHSSRARARMRVELEHLVA